MSKLLKRTASPHVMGQDSTGSIMFDVVIALVPAAAFGVYQFGLKALIIILTSIVTCVLTEYVYQNLMEKPVTILDGSAVVTGLLLALNLPPEVPLWIPFIGSVFAILIVKQLFGGIGQNFMNPALAARCFLLISFAGRMTTYSLDGVTGATPLAQLKAGAAVDTAAMFVGRIPGCIGETSVVAILIGAAYLLIKRIISFKIPVVYIGSFTLFLVLFGGHGVNLGYLAAHLCGGGLLIGAFFMATDYSSSPLTEKGRIVFGVLLGIFTGIFRLFGASAEGVSYAIIFCNLLVPLIERITLPTPFGRGRIRNV